MLFDSSFTQKSSTEHRLLEPETTAEEQVIEIYKEQRIDKNKQTHELKFMCCFTVLHKIYFS